MIKHITRREAKYLVPMSILSLLLLFFLLSFPHLQDTFEKDTYTLLELSVSRFLGGTVFLLLIPYLKLPILSFGRLPSVKALLLVLPAFLIAVNNFPILGLIRGSVYVDCTVEKAALFVLACLAIGFFEEIAFRGVIFPMLLTRLLSALKKRTAGKEAPTRVPYQTVAVFLSIVLTSAAFGLVHILNLFAGSNPLAVLLQIGYSFLIGGMCAIVLLRTRCIWLPVLIHAVYDVGGMLIEYLGGGKLWDTPTVILTIAVSVAVAVYFLILLFRTKTDVIEGLLQ